MYVGLDYIKVQNTAVVWMLCSVGQLYFVRAGGVQGRGHQLAQHRLHRQHRLHQPDQQEAHRPLSPAGRGVQVSHCAVSAPSNWG